MAGIKENALARYQQIALDLATRITKQEYPIGTKIHARSTVANTYQVSAETARKAIKLLADLEIVEAKQGSGFYVASMVKAIDFINQFKSVKTLKDIKNDIQKTMKQQQDAYQNLSELMDQFLDQTQRFNAVNPLMPFQLTLKAGDKHLGRSIGELKLWQSTTATIVAVRHNQELKVSPGPYAKIEAGDTIFFVGQGAAWQQVQNFFTADEQH